MPKKISLELLVLKEISCRKISFILAVISVAVASGFLCGTLVMLRGHDQRTSSLLGAKEKETSGRIEILQDEYRKMTIRMGFNVLILPKGQNLADFYAEDFSSKYMPEDYAARLANSKLVTIKHLLPSLQEKIHWTEGRRWIILIGTKGETPEAHINPRDPIQPPVPAWSAIIGHEIQYNLNLKKGDTIQILGKGFTVSGINQRRGTKDDITIWIPLDEAQELLGKKGLINGILALECKCAEANLDKVKEEIVSILPDVQIIEYAGIAKARFEARDLAEKEGVAAIEALKKHRKELKKEYESFAAMLIPLVAAGAMLWIAFLAYGNSSDRKYEVGILRATGLSSGGILYLFLGRALMAGLLGAIIGITAGTCGGTFKSGFPLTPHSILTLLSPKIVLAALISAPLLSVLASWIPAFLASQKDPADILREE